MLIGKLSILDLENSTTETYLFAADNTISI